MKTWIDFIGEKHYSKQGFIDESEQYGVTRRIPRHQLKRFRFGDRVMAAIREGKRPILFGYYVIERISGLSSTALKALSEKFSTKMIAEGGRVVHRGCGSYVEGATLTIEASLEEIAEVLKDERRVFVTFDVGFADIRAHPPTAFAGLIVLRNTQFSHIFDKDEQVARFKVSRVGRDETSVALAPESQLLEDGGKFLDRIDAWMTPANAPLTETLS